MIKDKKRIIKISEDDFRKLNLTYKEKEWVKVDENSRKLEIKTFDVNKIIDENYDYWKSNELVDLPLMICFHKAYSKEEIEKFKKKYNSSFYDDMYFSEAELFRIKYYTHMPSSIVFYPSCDLEMSFKKRKNYILVCSGEPIEIPTSEIDKIYLVALNNE